MSIRVLRRKKQAATTLATVLVIAACSCFGQTRTGEETPGEAEVTSTNRTRLTPRGDALRRLEEELSRTFKPFAPKTSLEGFSAPVYQPPRTVVVNPNAAETAERKKNWGLLSPEEVAGLEETAKLFDPLDKPQDSFFRKGKVREDLYLNYGKQKHANTPGSGMDYNPFAEKETKKTASYLTSEAEKEEALPEALRESRRALSEMSHADSEGNVFGRPTFKDIFSTSSLDSFDNKFVRDRDRSMLDEYRKMLNGPAQATTGPNTLPGLAPGAKSAIPGSVIGSYQPSGLEAQMKTINPTLGPKGPEDINAKVLNSWNPLYVTPKPAPQPRVEPPKPTFEFPKRKF